MKRFIVLLAITLSGMFLGACDGKPVGTPTPVITEVSAAPVEVQVDGMNKLSDYELSLKTLTQECFGASAGCLTTVSVRMKADPGVPRTDDYLLVYEITGDRNGTVTGSIQINQDEYFAQDHMIDKKTKNTKVSIRGISLEKL